MDLKGEKKDDIDFLRKKKLEELITNRLALQKKNVKIDLLHTKKYQMEIQIYIKK